MLRMILAAVVMLSPMAVFAQNPEGTTLEKQIDQLAGLIAGKLKESEKLKFEKVECTNPKDDPHGAWLRTDLSMKLKKRMVMFAPDAERELQLEYGFRLNQDGIEEVYIEAKFRKRGGAAEKIEELERLSSDDLRDKLRLSSTSISVPIDGSKAERDAKYREDKANPKVHVSGPLKTLVSATEKCDYTVELLVGPKDGKIDQFRPRKAMIEKGKVLALIDRENEYRIRITNNTKTETACRVYIDGIDMFDLSDDRLPNGEPAYRHIIVAAGKSLIIPGWHRSAKDKGSWNAFLVTEFGKGVASAANPIGPIGTINVVFAKSYEPGSEVAKSRSANETARGRDLEGKQEVLVRKIENPHECVVIHYSRGLEAAKK
jgi:hypothetical protein